MNPEMPQEQMQAGMEAPGEQAQPNGEVLSITLKAKQIIYNEKTNKGVMQMLTKTGDPMTALVQTTMFVLRIVFDEYIAKNKVSPDALIAASGDVVSALAELGTAAGAPMQEVEDQAKQVVAQQLQQKLSQQGRQPMPAGPHQMPDGATMGQAMPQKRGGIINQAMA